MTQNLIHLLAEDLKPTRALKSRDLWLLGSFYLAIAAAVVLYFFGLRYNFGETLTNGVALWKTGLFLAAFLSSMLLITHLSRPTGQVKKAYFLPVLVGILLFSYQAIIQAAGMGIDPFAAKSMEEAASPSCLLFVSLGGLLGSSLIWLFWARKIATNNPTLVGGLIGMAGSSTAAATYTLYCSMDNVAYIALYYITPVVAFTLLGALIGRRALKW